MMNKSKAKVSSLINNNQQRRDDSSETLCVEVALGLRHRIFNLKIEDWPNS
jgi:hypothetical protein